jgi:hypothetical protein
MVTAIPQGEDLASCAATQMNRRNRRASTPMRNTTKPFGNVGANNQTERNPNRKRSTVRKLPPAAAYADYERRICGAWRK